MLRQYVIPALAIAGFLFALRTAVQGNRPTPAATPVAQPAKAPFEHFIAASGLVEASTENIEIASPVAGLVAQVHVTPEQKVKPGDPLFTLDDRSLKAELAVRRSALAVAKAELARLKSLPVPEDVPPLEAQVLSAEVALAEARALFDFLPKDGQASVVSAEERARRRFAVERAEAQLLEARKRLDQVKSGATPEQIAIAEAEVQRAASQVGQTETELDRLIVRSPIEGQVLQVNIRPGEFAPASQTSSGLLMLGNIETLAIRADVDENDAWRFRPGRSARAFLRGNSEKGVDVTFSRVEPFVVPKRSLTGSATERVDTRVMQAIFTFRRSDLPVLVGQQMDVFIESDPLPSYNGSTTTATATP